MHVVANPKLSHHVGIGLTHAFPRNLSDFAVFKQKSVVHSKVGITALRGSIRRRRQQLTNAPYKRYVQIGEGTHTVLMEKNRMQLFEAVQQFLDEKLRPNM